MITLFMSDILVSICYKILVKTGYTLIVNAQGIDLKMSILLIGTSKISNYTCITLTTI